MQQLNKEKKKAADVGFENKDALRQLSRKGDRRVKERRVQHFDHLVHRCCLICLSFVHK